MRPDPGTYVLVMQSRRCVDAQIGRWGRLAVQPGYYLYVGSAFGPGGLAARVSRHCRPNKSKRWHVDYLREYARISTVCCSYDPARLEHRWAQRLAEMPDIVPIPGFGCSDCSCQAHLFFSRGRPDLEAFAAGVPGSVVTIGCEPPG